LQNTSTNAFLISQVPKIQKVIDYLELKGKDQKQRRMLEQALTNLAEKANLSDTTATELAIARSKIKIRDKRISWCLWTWKESNKSTSNNWKSKLCTAYGWYCKVHKIEWNDRPTYKADAKSIQPPSHETVRMFITGTRGALSLKIQISGETGLRPIEITGEKGIKVKDFHTEQSTITSVNTKRCDPRPPLKISDELKVRLQDYINSKGLRPDESIFKSAPETYAKDFRRAKKRLANEFKNPTIQAMKLYDIRHYYVTKLCKKIQNSEIVRQIVGHKNLNTTQRYMHIAVSENTEWLTEQTQDRKRAEELTIQDFQYCFTTPDGWMQFKKAK
jgi:integrase